MQTWKNDHAIWKSKQSRILQDAKKGEDFGKASEDLQALEPEPEAPPSADRIVSEPTYEGLTKLFAHGQPSLGLFSDEGGQFLGGHAMNTDNRQKTLGAFNDLWDGKSIKRTRAGDGHLTLYGRRLAVHLMVQPIVARVFMADPLASGTGFLARFLICEPTSTIGTRFHANAKGTFWALSSFENRLLQILETEMPMIKRTRELQPRTLRLSEAARSAMVEFSDAIEAEQAPGKKLANISGTASKAAEQAARIAGVLTLWRDLDAVEVDESDMVNGIGLARYYALEALRLSNAAIVSAEILRAEALRQWLLENWQEPEIMVRDVVQRGPNLLRESPKARDALLMLENHGWIVRLAEGTKVRGSARKAAWRIVRPASLAD
jgi:hypothetical protein